MIWESAASADLDCPFSDPLTASIAVFAACCDCFHVTQSCWLVSSGPSCASRAPVTDPIAAARVHAGGAARFIAPAFPAAAAALSPKATWTPRSWRLTHLAPGMKRFVTDSAQLLIESADFVFAGRS